MWQWEVVIQLYCIVLGHHRPIMHDIQCDTEMCLFRSQISSEHCWLLTRSLLSLVVYLFCFVASRCHQPSVRRTWETPAPGVTSTYRVSRCDAAFRSSQHASMTGIHGALAGWRPLRSSLLDSRAQDGISNNSDEQSVHTPQIGSNKSTRFLDIAFMWFDWTIGLCFNFLVCVFSLLPPPSRL